MNQPLSVSTLGAQAVDVDIRSVDLSYGTNHVLKGIDLHIRPGEFFAFLGPSGCGKTTLLRLIAGFNRADGGEVLVGGREVSHLPPWKRDVGMVFQSYALWPHMSVKRNVAFGLEERKVPRAEIERRVAAALELVGLSHLADRRPSQLSGGQQQRVAVARTIAIEPKVLLLDEPLSNLDAKMRVQVRRELRDLQQRLGLTTIFVTHDQEEANTICDRIAVMNDGAVQQVGSPMELYEKPANLFVASFLGTANIVPGRVIEEGGARLFEIDAGVRLPIPAHVTVPEGAKLVFRPQHASLGADGARDVSLPGTVLHSEFLGSTVRYGVKVGSAEVSIDVPFQSGEAIHKPGAAVEVGLSLNAAVWLAS
ncbi:ABC transporter ATP-binding protein [Chelatococcus daeguensis]|uniref:ABC transporter ATP-binding protein n=2 Tax=Chelatococcus TaxID=28209 RepID=A0AAC9JVL1_9HYPH|nr:MULTISPECIES: ABC transporter ATP-binding protein [Chelatococcus]APF39295.1 ABC transporter ATP-binding protein [Chelatococcus daeguensis]KZE29355.1 ABC transporter ATP-binding protein [Chelatococcus daeguensis]MBM3084093.1 ABC transporter ATP-binding protein [Chelatococcus daeguensis]CUA87381.1 ABC-type Fe3+/spermidine/putrescine transport systems, ATPase components [Chelatococcus sambhunathii]